MTRRLLSGGVIGLVVLLVSGCSPFPFAVGVERDGTDFTMAFAVCDGETAQISEISVAKDPSNADGDMIRIWELRAKNGATLNIKGPQVYRVKVGAELEPLVETVPLVVQDLGAGELSFFVEKSNEKPESSSARALWQTWSLTIDTSTMEERQMYTELHVGPGKNNAENGTATDEELYDLTCIPSKGNK